MGSSLAQYVEAEARTRAGADEIDGRGSPAPGALDDFGDGFRAGIVDRPGGAGALRRLALGRVDVGDDHLGVVKRLGDMHGVEANPAGADDDDAVAAARPRRSSSARHRR